MKNKKYILGWIGCFFTVTGGLLKMMHWPLAGIFLTLGLTFLAVVFFPGALYSNYKGSGRKKPMLYIAIFLTIFLNITGALFKIQHWPGAGNLIIAGILSPIVIFLPVYLYYYFKSEEQSLNNFFSILFLLVFFSVIDALLTVRISKDALDVPIDVMNTTKLNDYFTVKREVCYRQLFSDTANNKLQLAREIKSRSDELIQLIDTIKDEIILLANKDNKENTHEYRAIKMKDNSIIPFYVLFNENNYGGKLRKGMENLKGSLLLSLEGKSEEANYISKLLQTDKPKKARNWEVNEFSNSPVIFALYRLNTIQNNIAFAEIETLNVLCKNINK